MAMERFDERSRIVTHFSLQPTFPDKCFNFRFVQFYGYAADALPAPVPMQAHPRGGRRSGRLLNIVVLVCRFHDPIPVWMCRQDAVFDHRSMNTLSSSKAKDWASRLRRAR
jgi:hypothetical protein